MILKGTELVEKKNILNEIRHNSMTLQELRFFSIYLSKINARDTSTRKVKFKLEEFRKIIGIDKVTIQHFKNVTDSLLCKIIHVPNEDGTKGYTAFQLFKKCKVYEDQGDNNQWYVEIDAHDDSLPLMFNLKKNYFKYEIWNALRLKSKNQLHMYELLKQHESMGIREILLDQLKDWLGLDVDEYRRWDNFKKCVLDSCQKALKLYTDIKFQYEPIKTGRKITGVRFIISKNNGYKDMINLSEFIGEIDSEGPQIPVCSMVSNNINDHEKKYSNEYIEFLAGACNYEFSEEKMVVIKDQLVKAGYCKEDNDLETYEYLMDKYHELNAKDSIPKDSTSRRFGFLKWMIKKDIED